MGDKTWILSVLGYQTEVDIARLADNYHLYVIWLLLRKPVGMTGEIEWAPPVFLKRERYQEIFWTLENLILRNVIRQVRVDYIALEWKEDWLTRYQSVAIDRKLLESEEFDRFSFNLSLIQPQLHSMKFFVSLNCEKAKLFIKECLIAWAEGYVRHFRNDYLLPERQSELVVQALSEKYGSFWAQPFEIHAEVFPNVDILPVLLVLEEKGFIRLGEWKTLETGWSVPKRFMVSMLKQPFLVVDVSKADRGEFGYSIKDRELYFKGTPLQLNSTNAFFVSSFFGLLETVHWGVEIDVLVEEIDSALEEASPDIRAKNEKKLVYDRIPLLNDKLAELTQRSGFFSIRSRKVYLSNPDCLTISN